jgi:hypothetical protein
MHGLLTKGQVSREETAMSVIEPKKCVYHRSDGTDHEKVSPHFACARHVVCC